MESSSLSVLLSLSLLLLFNVPHSHSFSGKMQPKCQERERDALLEFKDTFYNGPCDDIFETRTVEGDYGGCCDLETSTTEGKNGDCCDSDNNGPKSLETWTVEDKNGDCCNWDGVECDEYSGHVVGLDLGSSCLSGSINSSSSIFRLGHLQRLNLSFNDFSCSKIPSAINNLSRLEILMLYHSNFSGQIPSEILLLTNLSHLSLNQLTLKSPDLRDLVQSLVKLEVLILESVEISTSIPDSLSRLTSLRQLTLSGCKLQGQIPPLVGNLTQLERIDLSNNHFIGEIPCLQNLTNLSHLLLNGNNLVGNAVSSFSNLTELVRIDLSYNQFTGEIFPQLLGSKLETLGLASCNLRSFPLLLQSQDILESLDLSSNNIFGDVPQWFLDVNVENLSFLNLSHNHLSGALPIPLTNSSLHYYHVSNNEFSGELPARMCGLVNLKIFDSSNNDLGGVLPQCLIDLVGFGNLSVLNLRNNGFYGSIPQVGNDECNLTMIDVSYNQLEGPVPRGLEYCTDLEFLNLGNNRIVDIFPFWLGTLPYLSLLILRSNRFHGIMAAQYFDGWKAMKVDVDKEDRTMSYASYGNGSYYYTVTMTNKGINVEYTKIPKSLIGFDLSSNYFTGEIPKSISTLKGLHFLNLSNNMLIGSIPFNLNGLTNLESLDLSYNKFSGEIPQQLTDLTALLSFDVSFNQLTGPIPQSKQFWTFENTSYQGNPGLSGLPSRGNVEIVLKHHLHHH